MNGLPQRVIIQEVAPRDGFQIEPRFVPLADKIALVDDLAGTGITKIEASSFVSPKAIPNLRDAAELFAGIKRQPGVTYVALVPNRQGASRAIAAGVDEINLVMSISETHNLANMQMTGAQSLRGFRQIFDEFGPALPPVNGTVATAFGCPFEGPQSEDRVMALVEDYLRIGFSGITLADTTGMANPRQVEALTAKVLRTFPECRLTLHFHNTRGMGLANVVAALQAGAIRFDASIGGIGGCPYAPGATGNICTEDLVHMCEAMGIDTGVDLLALLAISRRLPQLLGHDIPGQVAKAGRSEDLHPTPRHLQVPAK
jgi:hydroxymethylglutaryl-CoA lyase